MTPKINTLTLYSLRIWWRFHSSSISIIAWSTAAVTLMVSAITLVSPSRFYVFPAFLSPVISLCASLCVVCVGKADPPCSQAPLAGTPVFNHLIKHSSIYILQLSFQSSPDCSVTQSGIMLSGIFSSHPPSPRAFNKF